ncbi:MAG: GGDEF domain-containing protein [Planctomycetota bacterium]|nr:MAG: GGDEF domain-containing protein [Planctomycetota bacterium]
MLPDWANTERERLLIVNDPGDLVRLVRNRYPQFEVTVSPDYLTGVAALANSPTRGILVGVDPTARKLNSVIASLRKAAGSTSRLVLCCLPSGEPAARKALSAGADDYLIYPPKGEELDRALELPSAQLIADEVSSAQNMPSWNELSDLAEVLATIGKGKKTMLERLCRLIADSMRTPSVRLVVENDYVHTGDYNFEPALVEDINPAGRNFGKIFVGPRHRLPYTSDEVEKLRHYSRLIGHLLEAAQQQHQWQSLAMIDEITQLPNRRYVMQMLETLINRATTERFRITLLIFDLDGFKHFNDTYGHAAGDEILYETGQLFHKHCRKHDIVARYAGDEFIVVFWDAEQPRIAGSKHPSDALSVLHRVREALKSHEFSKLGPEVQGKITISGGLASFPWDAATAQGLIDRADEALLEAKHHGKNMIYLVGSQGKPIEESSTGS